MSWLDMGAAGRYLLWEPGHRRYDNFQHAMEAAGLKWLKHEITLPQNSPYSGCGYFRKCSEAAEEHFNNFSIGDALWVHFYILICDMYHDGAQPATWATRDHMLETWGG